MCVVRRNQTHGYQTQRGQSLLRRRELWRSYFKLKIQCFFLKLLSKPRPGNYKSTCFQKSNNSMLNVRANVQLEKLHVRFIQQPWMGFFHKRGERWRHFNNMKINVHFQLCQDFKGGAPRFQPRAPVEITFWSAFVPKFISTSYKLLRNGFLWAFMAIKTKGIFNHVGECFS